MRGINWGYYCAACGHFYYATRECPIHRPSYEELVRATLLDILDRLNQKDRR